MSGARYLSPIAVVTTTYDLDGGTAIFFTRSLRFSPQLSPFAFYEWISPRSSADTIKEVSGEMVTARMGAPIPRIQ